MKKYIVIVLALMLSVTVFSQKKKKNEEPVIEVPALPYDTKSNLITYSEVVEAKGSTTELYNKAIEWLKSYYKNPSNVIKSKDPEAGKIEGKARFRIWDQKEGTGTKTQAGMLEYDISIQCKDGRYKYTITNIGRKQSTFFPVEKWDAENKSSYKRMYASYLVQMNEEIQKVIDSLNKHMTAKPEAKEESW